MVAFTGTLSDTSIIPGTSPYDVGSLPEINYQSASSLSYLASAVLSSTIADNQPTSELSAEKTGVLAYNFGFNDWYERIHYSSINLALGNIVSQQNVPLYVWNAYFTSKTLSSVTSIGDTSGIVLQPPAALPLAFNALAELVFNFSVSTYGSPALNVDYFFNWSNAEDDTITVYGNRINAWAWRPDWSTPVMERLEWKTGVIQSYDGSEQRTKLRSTPRRFFEFEYLAEGADRRFLEASLWNWQSRIWALPIWADGEPITSTLNAGAMSVPCSTQYKDYHAGGLAIILKDGSKYEVVEIFQVNLNSIDLVRPTAKSWVPGEASVYPVRSARMSDETAIARFTSGASYGKVRFELAEASSFTESAGTLYRGHPVVLERSNWDDDVSVQYRRKVNRIDYDIGEVLVDDESNISQPSQSQRWLLIGKDKIYTKRGLLYYIAGKWKGIWTPTWADDFQLSDTIQSAQAFIDVEHSNYSLHYTVQPNKRDVRIELNNGTVYYRHINSVTELSSTVERLALDSALNVTVLVSDVKQISMMSLSRLESDAVEIAFWQGDTAEISANFTAPRNSD